MLPLFLYPLAFLGMVALPALAGIYLFRNRFQPQVVSSLMLWVDPRESQEGGRQIRRIRTPLLFFLELLALLFLVLAAADPQFRLPTGARPLVVVLDDSYSMLAGEDKNQSPRNLALSALKEELGRQLPYVTRLLLASDKPKLLGPPMRSSQEIIEQLENWNCGSGMANLNEAVMLAGEIGGENTLVLVLSDHPAPSSIPDKSRIQWWSFGKPRANAAFVSAARAEKEGADRILLEVANLSSEKAQITVTASTLDGKNQLLNKPVNLGPMEVNRIIATLPKGTGPIKAQLDDKELPIDSQILLQPFPERPIFTDIRMADGPLKDRISKALQSTRLCQPNPQKAQLIFTDNETNTEGATGWIVQCVSDKEASAFTGPYILDRSHPLTNGLGLQGVIWGAGKETRYDGTPVIMAGDIPLVTDLSIGSENPRHVLHLRLRPDLTTLQDSPDWPILIWNLVSWRSSQLEGLARANLRLGDQVPFTLEQPGDTIFLLTPLGSKKEIHVRGRQVQLPGEEVGTYTVSLQGKEWNYSVNTISRNESDLTKAETGKWGSWLDDETVRMDYLEINWILILLVLGLITVHLLLLGRNSSQSMLAPGRVIS